MQVTAAIPQLVSPEAFYEARDARGALEYPLATVPARRIAIVGPPDDTGPALGREIALFWTTSMIRRMGRAFAEIIIVTPDPFRNADSQLAGSAGRSIEQRLTEELRAADPFARIEWRAWANLPDLSDAATVIWLGNLPPGFRHGHAFAINAHGWIAAVNRPMENELSLSPPGIEFDAAPAAIALAASIVAAHVFADAFERHDRPSSVAVALDSGRASSDAATCHEWLVAGASVPTAPPWKENGADVPTLARLLVVSAGGICGNFCQIMRDSFLRIASGYVVDPDVFDISNLNRSIGVGVSSLGAPKAAIAASVLQPRAERAEAAGQSYEAWITAERAQEFRQPGSAVVVGVDQVRTRLAVGSDWPSVLLNGSTSGATFSVGLHVRGGGGCVGCWYGQDEATYVATRTPMACAAGAAPGTIEFRPVPSYPFVSVAAAAYLVAALARAAHQPEHWRDYAGTIASMSVRSPEFAQTRRIPVSERCLLLCSADYVQTVLGREAEVR